MRRLYAALNGAEHGHGKQRVKRQDGFAMWVWSGMEKISWVDQVSIETGW